MALWIRPPLGTRGQAVAASGRSWTLSPGDGRDRDPNASLGDTRSPTSVVQTALLPR